MEQPQQTREQFIEGLFNIVPEDNFVTGEQAVKKIVAGINKAADMIKLSYGPSGSNAIVQAYEYPYHRVTNDGKLILKDVKLKDPYEQIGFNIIREVADKSDKESGDGRKTTILLTQAILNEGLKAEGSLMEIKRSLDECLTIILEQLDEQTEEVLPHNVGKVAEVASESKFLGDLFQEIYTKIGKDGIIELDNSGTSDTFYDITEGVRLHGCGFMYAYMANEDKQRKAVYNNPNIMISKEPIKNIKVLDSILKKVSMSGKDELVIFTEDIDVQVSSALAFLHQGVNPDGTQATPFKTLVVKMPTIWKDWLYEDISKITGATIIDPSAGKTLVGFKPEWLGTCTKIATDKEETIVLGIKDISDHLEALKEENTDEGKLRISRLKTRTAILKLGANSESDLSLLKGKALDGRNSSYLALNHGIIDGAGEALFKIRFYEPSIGGQILTQALAYPYLHICENMGIKPGKEFGVKDASVVVKNAITNAISVAGTVLTAKTVVTLPKHG